MKITIDNLLGLGARDYTEALDQAFAPLLRRSLAS
jgi:hypothetical protein